MIFVQYFQKGMITGRPIEACGDRSVLVLDGRQSVQTWHNDAKENNGLRRPVYCGYQLFKGETFTRSCAISPYVSLS